MKQIILDAAIELANEVGYQKITREALAARAGCSPAQVSRLFGTMNQLRRAVMGEAIRVDALRVIAQGLAVHDTRACGISDAQRARVLMELA